MRCHKVQGMTEAFTDTLYSLVKTSSSVHQKAVLFSSETADKFARDCAIKKSFRHALYLVTVHLHRQNQGAHALCTRVTRNLNRLANCKGFCGTDSCNICFTAADSDRLEVKDLQIQTEIIETVDKN